ncbi:HAD-IA family hydrolase [Halobacteria archaeon AArc-curdl1]|uniref:HAD-IA family hydrolase n=1 Tax=Natronosalvus hydrolyticus TaxID=2979988 RepID=A0AAP2ZCI0_9EURY|nr:HAD-IA family hydrolase [Halobacteria archaeon AArc-curdl1]
MKYDAVIFDNDGVLTTLTDHEKLRRASAYAFKTQGVEEPTRADLETLFSPTVEEIHGIATRYDIDADSLWAARERAAIEEQRDAIVAGEKTLYEDVTTLTDLEVPRAIVSNNQHETIETIVDYFDLEGFDPYYGREPTIAGIERKKPTPYYLENAIDDMGCSNPLYVGDSWVDVAVSETIGIDSVFLRRSHREAYQFSQYGFDGEPTYEIAGLDGLPSILHG